MEGITCFDELSQAKGLKITHINVRSIIKKIDQIRLLLADSKIDVLTVSETWLKPHLHSDLISIQGFSELRLDRQLRAGKKRGGGLLTYINTKHVSSCESLTDMNSSNDFIEAQWSLLHRAHCKNIVICNVYRPPTGDLSKAMNYLDDCLKSINLSKVHVFILGDMNVNFKNKSSPAFKKVTFFAQSNGLWQYITNSTRNTDKTSSLLDIAFSNSNFIEQSGTLEHFISDHQPIFLVHKKGRDKRDSVKFSGRSYRNFDKNKFKEHLLGAGWREFGNITDPELAWDYILSKITLVLDQMCPVRTFHIKNYRPDWMTDELIEQTKDRDYFYKQAKKRGDKDTWNIARYLRNVTNSNIRAAKRDFVLEQLHENENNAKKFWKTIHSVIPSCKTPTSQEILLKDNGRKINRDEVAPYINDFFINVGNSKAPSPVPDNNSANIEDPFPVPDSNGANLNDVVPNPHLMSSGSFPHLERFVCLREAEVSRVLKDVNIYKSSGLDNLSSYIIKEAFTILLPKITKMYNLSFEKAIFPEKWKKALVIPIPKTGNLTNVQNYRPISLLPLPGKILEKLAHIQLTDFLEGNELLSTAQHGFRKQHSTIDAIAQFTSYVNTKMDSNQTVLATYIDFKKAFDCVQHNVLIEKLSSLGINHTVIDWIGSYLTNRQQRVLANSIYSNFKSVTQGVPQGSVLGPLFYIVYANDLSKIFKKCEATYYADDTVLFTANVNFAESVQKLQGDIDALMEWCKENSIFVNTSKTKIMTFGSPSKLSKLPEFEIKYDGTPLQNVTSYKYLGMTMDNQLNYKLHINKVISSVSGKLKQFQRMRSFLSVKAAVLVYKSMLLPILEYGDIFLSAASVANRKKLQTLQNKGLRCALNKGIDVSSDSSHTEARLLKLKFRREQHMLNYMYDWSRNPEKLNNRSVLGIKTRSHSKRLLKIRKPRTEKFKKSLAYQGPNKWNSLSQEYHQIPSKAAFKVRIGAHILQKTKPEGWSLD